MKISLKTFLNFGFLFEIFIFAITLIFSVGVAINYLVGQDISQEPGWGFVQEDTFASRGQKMIYHGWLHPLEALRLRSPLVPWSYFASNFYHNVYWYPFVGRRRVQSALETKWGRLFQNYGSEVGLQGAVMPGMEPKTVTAAAGGLAAATLLAGGLALALRGRRD